MSRKHLRFLVGIWVLGALLLGGLSTIGCLDDLTLEMGLCADDGNPCTNSDCTLGVTKHDSVRDLTACALGMNAGVCIKGVCKLDCAKSDPTTCPCDTAADCPNSPDCEIFSCEAGRCANPEQKACRGALCMSDTNCAGGFCRDGVCCESTCNEMCKSCAVAGSLGVCDFIPMYSDDDSYTDAGYLCSAANYLTCDGQGHCLGLVGAQCSANDECLSNICAQLSCQRAAAGAPCPDAEQCQSKSCVGGKCGAVP